MAELTEYEARQVAEIAAWKGEKPGPVARAMQRVRGPIGQLIGMTVPGSMVRTLTEKTEALIEHHDGLQEIVKAAGVHDIAELRSKSLEECDRLAKTVSARAQHQALVEGAASGIGGIATELLNVPVLIAAAVRAIRRIGHCYGYPLDTEPDRMFVLGVLELSMAEDPAHRSQIRERLQNMAAFEQACDFEDLKLEAVKSEIVDELLLEAVPILGDLASIALDYSFMRRVDVTARLVFQERWLRDAGKITASIPPAPAGHRVHTIRTARELLAETVYLGGYGVGFAVTTPVVFAGRLASLLPAPAVRGATEGAADAAESARQFAAGWGALAAPARPPAKPLQLPA